MPQGYTLHGEATYDNTANNPFNTNDPPEWVTFGEATGDEMFLIFIDLVLYEEGDESIALGPEEPDCPGDVSGDGIIGVADVLLLLANFGCLEACPEDIDGDGAVTVGDVLALLGNFGADC